MGCNGSSKTPSCWNDMEELKYLMCAIECCQCPKIPPPPVCKMLLPPRIEELPPYIPPPAPCCPPPPCPPPKPCLPICIGPFPAPPLKCPPCPPQPCCPPCCPLPCYPGPYC